MSSWKTADKYWTLVDMHIEFLEVQFTLRFTTAVKMDWWMDRDLNRWIYDAINIAKFNCIHCTILSTFRYVWKFSWWSILGGDNGC